MIEGNLKSYHDTAVISHPWPGCYQSPLGGGPPGAESTSTRPRSLNTLNLGISAFNLKFPAHATCLVTDRHRD